MANLTDEDISAVFHVFDENGDDVLSMTELQNALSLLSIDLTPAEYEDALHEEEGRETMNEEEFRMFVREKFSEMDYKQRCRDCFDEFVEDKPGCISLETMKRILTMMGDTPLDDDKVDELVDSIDKDDDGFIDIDELVEFMYNRDGIGQESLEQGV